MGLRKVKLPLIILGILIVGTIVKFAYSEVNLESKSPLSLPATITYRQEGGHSPYRFIEVRINIDTEGKGIANCSYQFRFPSKPGEIKKLTPLEIPKCTTEQLLKTFVKIDFFNLRISKESLISYRDASTITISYLSEDKQKTISYYGFEGRLTKLALAIDDTMSYARYLQILQNLIAHKEGEITFLSDGPFGAGIIREVINIGLVEQEKVISYWMRILRDEDLRKVYGERAVEDLKLLTGRDFYEEAFQKEGGYKREVEYEMWLGWWEKNKPDLNEKKRISKEGHPKLESVLYELTKATDYEGFAKSRLLYILDNKVRVIIELVSSDYILAEDFGKEESRYENLLQALVYIDKLLKLAEEPGIKFIRRPHTPIALSGPLRLSFQGREATFDLKLGRTVRVVEDDIGGADIKLLSLDDRGAKILLLGFEIGQERQIAIGADTYFLTGGEEQGATLYLLEIKDDTAKFKISFWSAPPAPEISDDMPIDIIYLD